MSKRALYFLTPEHKNAGDHLQAYCIRTMLRRFYDTVLEFTFNRTAKGIQLVQEGDTIFLSSGGNLGDMYLRGEMKRRQIIDSCHGNTIVSFPQTIDFKSKEEAAKSSAIYQAHPNLYIFARDTVSYCIAKELFPSNNVQQLPDPVFKLAYKSDYKREGILCIFRKDKEGRKHSDKRDYALERCRQIDQIVDEIDIILPNVMIEEMSALLDKISHYRLVVTDRLHGTIFAAITGTPCIAFPTINHKITGTIYWHKKFGTELRLVESIPDFEEYIGKIPEPFVYDPSDAISLYYQVIIAIEATDTIPNLNRVENTIISRRTIRRWKDTTLPNNILTDIIRAGVYAPSGNNAQAVKFRIIGDVSRVTAISKDCFNRTTDMPPAIIMVGYDFNVKHTINYQHRSPEWEALKYQDVAAAIQNMQLYCESIGLSCCWLSFFIKSRQELLADMNIVNDNIEYISALAVGFAKSQALEAVHPSRRGRKIERKDVKEYILHG